MIARAWIALVALSLAACSKDDCERAYETEKKCGKSDKLPDKDVFVLGCNAALKSDKLKDEIGGEIECAQNDSCEEFEKCRKGRRGKARAQEVTKAIEAGKWKEAWDDCTLIADYYADDTYRAACTKVFKEAKLEGEDAKHASFRCKMSDEIAKAAPDFVARCKQMQAGELATARTAATAARDAGKNDFKACLELQQAAASDAKEKAAAKLLCDELAQAENAKQAIDEATANVAAKKSDMPFKCSYASDQLAKLDTPWAKQTLEAVLKACYIDLGAVVLTVEAKEAKYVCPYRVKRTMEPITKYGLVEKSPELAAVIAKLPKKCK